MNFDSPTIAANVETELAIKESLTLRLRAIRLQELGERDQARAILRDAAMVLMKRSQQIQAEVQR